MRIDIDNLSYSYDGKKNVLENVKISLSDGICYVLAGKNGAGKTTLSKLLMGLIKPPKGKIFLDGIDVRKMRTGKIAKSIGYVFQDPTLQFFANTVEDELAFPYKLTKKYDDETREKIARALTIFGLSDLTNRHPLTLSTGEKQRLALAAATLENPQFLILDEPTASIDQEGREFVTAFIADFVKKGGGALIISHDDTLFEGVRIEI